MYERFRRLKWKKDFQKEYFSYKNDTNVFNSIYNNNIWGSNESRSGGGSEVNNTKIIRKMLSVLWKKYGIKTFLDVPCGDYNWMKEVVKDDISYIGGDIVKEIIDQNNKKYKKENISFNVIDITQDNLPAVDMIFCKDCLQHLSYDNIFKALRNFKKSNSKYLLTTTYPLTLSNWDIFDGDYRPLNLRIKPFNLPVPIEKIHETPTGVAVEKDKYMYLYKLEDIKIS
jgi:2-polyprenyl-3-methyl-5-hydroxy-6-metoxy-1,4-benzoquinol methylase